MNRETAEKARELLVIINKCETEILKLQSVEKGIEKSINYVNSVDLHVPSFNESEDYKITLKVTRHIALDIVRCNISNLKDLIISCENNLNKL